MVTRDYENCPLDQDHCGRGILGLGLASICIQSEFCAAPLATKGAGEPPADGLTISLDEAMRQVRAADPEGFDRGIRIADAAILAAQQGGAQ